MSESPKSSPDLPVAVRGYESMADRIRAIGGVGHTVRTFSEQIDPTTGARFPLMQVTITPPHGQARFQVMINGGTHGDEPAGTEAVVSLLESGHLAQWPDVAFVVHPCTNPWGYAHDRREGPGGADLNRSFRRALRCTPEVSAIKQALRGRRFDLYLDCHEDVDAAGLYAFAPTRLGRTIVDAVRQIGPIFEGELVDGEIPIADGVVHTDSERSRARRTDWLTWPLPYYIARYHQTDRGAHNLSGEFDPTALSGATIETPVRLPLAERVRMHHVAIQAALTLLHEFSASSFTMVEITPQ